jgi:hypothetical protein
MAGLRPPLLDRLAEDGYLRNRHDDLATMAADRHPAGNAGISNGGIPKARRTRWPVLAGGAVAVGAAAAVAVTLALPAGKPASPRPSAVAPGSSAAVPTAQSVLLTSATVAARSPAAAGNYWYARERDYEPAIARSGHLKNTKALSFGATFAATQESWTGQHRARTIVNEDLAFTFASAADRARWVAAGKPALSTQAGFGVTRPVTSDYTMTLHWGVGRHQLGLADFGKLPVRAGDLGKLLRKWWASEPDKAGAVGFKNPDYAQYLVQWADVLLTGPARPGTRAAIYRLLAGEPGLKLIPGVTDPLGREGIAVGDGGGDYLVIQPATARLLAYASHRVRAGSMMPASAGLEVYEASGWAVKLAVAP